MILTILPRREGKTWYAIKQCFEHDAQLIVFSREEALRVAEEAKRMGVVIR